MSPRRRITLSLPNGSGPQVFQPEVGFSLEEISRICAWSNDDSNNVYLLRGEYDVVAAQELVKREGVKDILAVLTGKMPLLINTEDVSGGKLSVFFEGKNETTQTQCVVVEVW